MHDYLIPNYAEHLQWRPDYWFLNWHWIKDKLEPNIEQILAQ